MHQQLVIVHSFDKSELGSIIDNFAQNDTILTVGHTLNVVRSAAAMESAPKIGEP